MKAALDPVVSVSYFTQQNFMTTIEPSLEPSHAESKHSSFVVPLTVAFIAVLLSSAFLLHHIGHTKFGNFYWALSPSAWFGTPESEKAQGLTPLYRNCCGELGFDGQFYYHISNDPFIGKDVKLHLDAPSYRYQRVFPAVLAKLISLTLLSSNVNPATYYATLLVLYGVGVFALASYLQQWNAPVWYSLAWAFFFGTQYSLLSGSVDVAGDALLVVALAAALRGGVWSYAAFMSAAVLTRETYSLIATGFLAYQLFRHIRSRKMVNVIVAYSLPLIAVAGWYAYVHSQLPPLPLSQALRILNLPLRGFWGALRPELSARLTTDTRYNILALAVYGALLFVGSATTLRLSSAHRQFTALFAYTLLLACLGPTVMDFGANFLRVSSILLAMLALCLPHIRGRLHTACALTMIASTSAGGLLLYREDIKTVIVPPVAYNSSVPGAPLKIPRQGFDCDLHPVSFALRPDVTIPLGSLFAPPYFTIAVRGKNLSEMPLQKDRDPQGRATYLYYRWLEPDGRPIMVPESLRSSLPSDVAPGSEFVARVLVLPPAKAGLYQLRLSLIDEGEAEFPLRGNCKVEMPVSVSHTGVTFPVQELSTF